MNNDFANATVVPLGATPFNDIVDTSTASVEATDPQPSCGSNDQFTIWYTATTTVTCEATYDTAGSDYDTVLSVWTGSLGNLTQIACHDDVNPIFDPTSIVTITQQANITYFILVSTLGGEIPGTSNFSAICRPSNDDHDDATVIPPGACPFVDSTDTTLATTEPGDPQASCSTGDTNTVWYTSTSSVDCLATYDTRGSNYDTVLSVWTGTPGNFNEVICNDDKFGDTSSEVEFVQSSGITYSILVATKGGGTAGELLFNCCCLPLGPPPNAPSVIEDAWTLTPTNLIVCGPECEDYLFNVAVESQVLLIDKYKVPSEGYPDGISVDYLFQPSNPISPDNLEGEDICLPPRTSNNLLILILNDIYFGPENFPANSTPYEVLVSVDLSNFPQPNPGEELKFDWWKVVEFRPNGPFLDGEPADCDGDGDLDCGFIFNRSQPIPIIPALDTCQPPFGGLFFRLTDGTDNFGAEVIEYFVNRTAHNLRCINVFEPHPPQPARNYPGVEPGEDSGTRPWCFTLSNVPIR